jgi:hypothetical protein
VLKMMLEELRLIEEQIDQLDQEMASLLSRHQDAVQRLAEVPGLGVDSAQQIIDHRRSGCHGSDISFREESLLMGWRMPRRQRECWRELRPSVSEGQPKHAVTSQSVNQSANAAVKAKGTIFEVIYRRTVPRLGYKQTIGAVAHRQCRLIWKILLQGVRYEERGPDVGPCGRFSYLSTRGASMD